MNASPLILYIIHVPAIPVALKLSYKVGNHQLHEKDILREITLPPSTIICTSSVTFVTEIDDPCCSSSRFQGTVGSVSHKSKFGQHIFRKPTLWNPSDIGLFTKAALCKS